MQQKGFEPKKNVLGGVGEQGIQKNIVLVPEEGEVTKDYRKHCSVCS